MLEALFLQGSAWTQPVETCATYVSAGNATSVPVGLDTWLQGDPWSIPLYVANTSDPQRHLLYNKDAWLNVATGKWQRFGNNPTVEQDILRTSTDFFPYPGNVFSSTSTTQWVLPADYNATDTNSPADCFHMAATAVPASGSDGHMAVQQPEGTVIETYATIVLSSGDVVALSYSETDPNSLADGWQNGKTASMLPSYAGVVDDKEIADGHIDHAMAVTIPASLLAPIIQYPAYAFDRNATTQNPPYSGTIPMGARLALPRSTSIASMNLLTPAGTIIATSAKTYGFIVVDRGGGGISLRVRKNPAVPNPLLHTWNWGVQSDLIEIFRRIKLVTPCTAP